MEKNPEIRKNGLIVIISSKHFTSVIFTNVQLTELGKKMSQTSKTGFGQVKIMKEFV